MSKIDTNIVKDGQLAVATIPQTGTIISSKGEIDTTALVQTSDGPQLCVKTVDLNGGGGGGGGGNTYVAGQGIQIVQGIPSTIEISNMPNGYASIPWKNPSKSFEFRGHYLTPSSSTSSSNNLLVCVNDCIWMQIYGDLTSSVNQIRIWLYNTSSTIITSDTVVSPGGIGHNKHIYIKLKWKDNRYSFSYKFSRTDDWIEYWTLDSSTPVAAEVQNTVSLGSSEPYVASNCWNGTLFLYDCYLNVDDEILFDGISATANDYTINGTPTITGSNADPTNPNKTILLGV